MKTILVVEDDADVRQSLKHLLEGEGFKVVTAKNGDEGLERLWETAPNLIVLDLMMPVMDGFEFKRIMDTHPERSKIPVIVFTSQPELVLGEMNVTGILKKTSSIDKILGA